MGKGQKKDTSLCPSCDKKHDGPVPTKPTQCGSCRAASLLKKEEAQKRKAAEDAAKRLPNEDPVPMDLLKKQKKFLNGDVFVRTHAGWFFLPGDAGLVMIVVFIFSLCKNARMFLDWGGVAALFLQQANKKYIQKPKKLKSGFIGFTWIFSYTPLSKFGDLDKMWAAAEAAGFQGMIITTEKGVNDKGKALHDQVGKHQLLSALLKLWDGPKPDYYEDTAAVLDNLVASEGGSKATCFWVRPKDKLFQGMVPEADSVIWMEQEEFLEKIRA